METRVQIVAIVVSTGLFGVILELVRRRRLMERYALLWLTCALILLGLSIWRGGLERFSQLVGIAYAPSAMFVVALGFILLLLQWASELIKRVAILRGDLEDAAAGGGHHVAAEAEAARLLAEAERERHAAKAGV